MLTPGTPISKLTAIAILVLILVCIAFVVVLPLTGKYLAQNRRLEEISTLIARFDGEVRALSLTQNAQDSLAPEQPLFIDAPNELIATGLLQKSIKKAFDASGISLMRLSFLPAADMDDMQVLSLSFQARGELAALQKALHRLEASNPPVFVDGVFLRRQNTPTQDADPATSNDSDRTLIADITLSSLWTMEDAR